MKFIVEKGNEGVLKFEYINRYIRYVYHIINEFVLERENDWWMEYYSRSTYYRVKTRAMEEALFYFNCL